MKLIGAQIVIECLKEQGLSLIHIWSLVTGERQTKIKKRKEASREQRK